MNRTIPLLLCLCLLLAGCGAPGGDDATSGATTTGAATSAGAPSASAAAGFVRAEDVVTAGEARLPDLAFADAGDEEEAAFAGLLGFDGTVTGRVADGVSYFLVSAGDPALPEDTVALLQEAAGAWADAREEEWACAGGAHHCAAVFALDQDTCNAVLRALEEAWQGAPLTDQ